MQSEVTDPSPLLRREIFAANIRPAIKPACCKAGFLAVCHVICLAGLLGISQACFQGAALSGWLSCLPARFQASQLSFCHAVRPAMWFAIALAGRQAGEPDS